MNSAKTSVKSGDEGSRRAGSSRNLPGARPWALGKELQEGDPTACSQIAFPAVRGKTGRTGSRKGTASRTVQVLIIEHDEFLRERHCAALRAQGISCDSAGDARTGLALLKRGLPKVILLDLLMPIMNGWDFVETLKADKRLAKVPVLVMTPFPLENLRYLAAAAVLLKPIREEKLVEAVKGFL